MFFARVADGSAVEFPLSEVMLRRALASTSLPTPITPECLAGTGFVCVQTPPASEFPVATKDARVGISSVVEGANGFWKAVYELVEVPDKDKAKRLAKKWDEVRANRASKFNELDNLIAKTQRELRMGVEPVYSLEILDVYGASLADVTKQQDPFLIVWPTLPSTIPTA